MTHDSNITYIIIIIFGFIAVVNMALADSSMFGQTPSVRPLKKKIAWRYFWFWATVVILAFMFHTVGGTMNNLDISIHRAFDWAGIYSATFGMCMAFFRIFLPWLNTKMIFIRQKHSME